MRMKRRRKKENGPMGGGQGSNPVDCLALISPLSSNGSLYAPFDERKYSNRYGAGLENESD